MHFKITFVALTFNGVRFINKAKTDKWPLDPYVCYTTMSGVHRFLFLFSGKFCVLFSGSFYAAVAAFSTIVNVSSAVNITKLLILISHRYFVHSIKKNDAL